MLVVNKGKKCRILCAVRLRMFEETRSQSEFCSVSVGAGAVHKLSEEV